MTYCVFNVGDRRLGIAMQHVREIIEPHQIVPTPIPHTPRHFHGLFNLRGQVLPFLDLAPFVGGEPSANPREAAAAPRAVVVERGEFRFATLGRRIDTVEADPETFSALADAALHPALDAEARTEMGNFQVVHLDRLEACLIQILKTVPSSEFQVPSSDPGTPNVELVERGTRNVEPGTPI